MSQTTMKIDRDVLAELKELATIAHRSPQKHLRYLVEREKSKIKLKYRVLTLEQQERADIVKDVEASAMLEGYPPLSVIGGYAYELQQQWVRGDITSKEKGRLLAQHYGYEYVE